MTIHSVSPIALHAPRATRHTACEIADRQGHGQHHPAGKVIPVNKVRKRYVGFRGIPKSIHRLTRDGFLDDPDQRHYDTEKQDPCATTALMPRALPTSRIVNAARNARPSTVRDGAIDTGRCASESDAAASSPDRIVAFA